MLVRWLKWRREAFARVSADAEILIAQFGDGAYGEARMRAVCALKRKPFDPHWGKVRRLIGKRTRRVFLDTATRYLEEQNP